MTLAEKNNNHKNNNSPMKSQKIRTLRKSLALSYAKFGMPCGYVGGYISCVERGEVHVSDEFCEKICLAYGVEKEWLLNDDIPVEPVLNLKKKPQESGPELCIPSGQAYAPGDRLKSILQGSGLSQREFCRRLGTSTSMIGALLDGRRQITQRYAQKIEKVFHVGLEWLLYGREECKENPCSDEMIAFLKGHPEARKMVSGLMESEAEKSGNATRK